MKLFGTKFTERDLLIIVDGQNDFVGGVLGTKRAKELIPYMADFIDLFPGKKIFTKDTHGPDYLNTQEGRYLPIIHTVKGTHGWELVDEFKELVTEDDIIIEKDAFGSLELANLLKTMTFDNIYVIGFDTIYCVLSNIVLAKSAAPETPIHVIASMCACATRVTHKIALHVLRTLQVDVIDDDVPGTVLVTEDNLVGGA